MKSGTQPRGYTVVELMIFLAVSAALLLGALYLVGGQQAKTEFTQSARELESQIKDIINDVAVGFYPTNVSIRCTALPAGGPLNLTEQNVEQGTNSNCTFIGRVIQFAPHGSDRRGIRVYTIAGRRLDASNREVSSMVQAQGRAVAKSSAGDSAPNVYEDFDIGSSRIQRVAYNDGTVKDTGGIGFFTTFGAYTGGTLTSTAANLIPVPNTPLPTALDQDQYTFVSRLNTKLSPAEAASLPVNPSGGITICIVSSATQQHAILQIGGQSRTLTTKLTINNGTVCP